MRTRRYSELRRIDTFEERFDYLSLQGMVAQSTFGFDRYLNQQFYRSTQWRQVRNRVIARDLGMDLGVEGYEIFDKVIIHHMNPMTADALEDGDPAVLDPEFLITTTHSTHNAIHYGDRALLPKQYVDRSPGDTQLWSRR